MNLKLFCLIFSVCLITSFVLGNVNPVESGKAKPDTIFIMADDLGCGDIGCYNPESRISTPNIDLLASHGKKCTDAHSPSSVCAQTKYGLLTGRCAWRGMIKRGIMEEPHMPIIEDDRCDLISDHTDIVDEPRLTPADYVSQVYKWQK